jgi:hypothetical protein
LRPSVCEPGGRGGQPVVSSGESQALSSRFASSRTCASVSLA